jgi:hypothetical protein
MKQTLDERQAALGKQLARLGALKSRSKVLEDTDEVRRELNSLAMEMSDLDAVRSEFIKLNKRDPRGVIKTPSVVLSWDSREFGTVGGHNLRARALRFEPTPDVEGLALADTPSGVVLRYHPSKTDIVLERAGDIARAVEHGQVKSTNDLSRLLEGTIGTRTRAVALQIPERASDARPSFGRLGARAYAEKKPFVEDLREIAAKNECCLFVARDEQQVAYIARKNPSPPPPALVTEARDTPSVSSVLKGTSGRRGKTIIFLDQPEAHVRALALDLTADAPSPRGLMEFARSIRAKAADRIDAILGTDLRGEGVVIRASELEGNVDTRAALSRFAVPLSPQSWSQAQIRTLDQNVAETLVARARWDVTRDGVPTAVAVSLPSPTSSPLDVTVVIGVERSNIGAAHTALLASHQDVVATAATRQATMAQYVMTMKTNLQRLSDLQIKRLLFVVQEGLTKALFSQNHDADAVVAPL